jgi:hypothetical protein
MTDIVKLHDFHNGASLVRLSARLLLTYPTWKGNRILDREHVNSIKNAMEMAGTDCKSLDSGYHIIICTEVDADNKPIVQRYLIDGQHRREVVAQMLEPVDDFPVVAIEKYVTSEIEAIMYFNCINNTKPIHFKEDPTQIANRYLMALMEAFPKKLKLFRTGRTTRPFMNCDDLRKELIKYIDDLAKIPEKLFVTRVKEINGIAVRELEVGLAMYNSSKDHSIKEKAVKLGFALAVDNKMKWLSTACI